MSVGFLYGVGGGGNAGGGGELNIAYGLTPPQDTSKLWVKRATEPDKVILKNWFNGDVDGVGIADIDTFPLQLEAAACAVIGGKCYIFGGKASNTVQTKIYKYDTENNTLTELTATLPAGRQGLACGIVGTNIYLFGGSASIYNSYTKTIYKFDTLTETITTLTIKLPKKLGQFNCSVVGANCYLIGGYSDSDSPSYTSNTIYKFDTTTETITSYKALPAQLYNAACGSVGTNIYIFGGYNGGSSAYSDKIYKVDTATNILTTLSATLPEAKQEMGVGVVGTNIYLFGGTTSSNAFGTSEIYKFDTETNAISILSTTLLHSIKGMAYGVVGTDVYLFAGMYVGYIQKFTVSVGLAENNLFITYNANLEADTKIINWETAEFFISINAMLIGNSNDFAEAVHWAIHDGTNWVNDDGTIEFTKLYPPTISISGATLTIVNDSRNSSYVTAYKIYNGQTLLTTTANTTVDLSSIISTAGTYNLTVVASGTGYTDSNASNAVELSAYSITNVLTNVSAAAGNATVLLSTQSSVALTYMADSGYNLPQGSTSAELNVVGADFTWNQSTGVLTLSNPTGNITVTIVGDVAASNFTVTFSEDVEVTSNGISLTSGDSVSRGTILTITIINEAYVSVSVSHCIYANSDEIYSSEDDGYPLMATYTVLGDVYFEYNFYVV